MAQIRKEFSRLMKLKPLKRLKTPMRNLNQDEKLLAFIRSEILLILNMKSEEVENDESLFMYNIDSLNIIDFQSALEKELGIIVPITLFLEKQTINEIHQYLLQDFSEEISSWKGEILLNRLEEKQSLDI